MEDSAKSVAENVKEISSKSENVHISDGSNRNTCFVTEGSSNAQKMDINSLLGSYITKEYELLYLVLSHLPLADLNAASKVCRTWNVTAATVRRSRIKPHWILCHSDKRQKKLPFMSKHACYTRSMESVPYVAFHDYIYSEPVLALMFASQNAYGTNILCTDEDACPSSTSANDAGENYHQHRVWEYVKAELQPSCSLICLRGYGIIGTLPDLSETVELEHSKGYSLLLLPEMPGVTIYTFSLDKVQAAKLHQTQLHDLGPGVIENLTGIPEGEPIRCLLLFCQESPSFAPSIDHLVNALQMRQDETMVIAGGVHAEVAGVKEKAPVVVGVAFLGNGLSVASTVLDHNLNTEEDADRVMQEFKSHTIKNYENSIGLMFACVGRGKMLYSGKRNVESATFRKHFPKTPLFGYFGNGEIGFKFLPDVIDDKKQTTGPPREKRKKTDISEILHCYTTIMVHIAFTGSNANDHTHR